MTKEQIITMLYNDGISGALIEQMTEAELEKAARYEYYNDYHDYINFLAAKYKYYDDYNDYMNCLAAKYDI